MITGASSGFGSEFARCLAARGYDLCLAARREERLKALKAELEAGFGVRVDILAVDLAADSRPEVLHAFTSKESVDVLVNNAGIFTMGLPGEAGLAEELRAIDLNVRALHALTRLYLEDMRARDSGRILNVASMAAWVPVPTMSAYAAGKAYVRNLSEGLDFELRRTGSRVRISVLTPGYFNTEISGQRYRLRAQGRTAAPFADRAIRRLLAGARVISIGRDWWIARILSCLPRSLAVRLVYASARREWSIRTWPWSGPS